MLGIDDSDGRLLTVGPYDFELFDTLGELLIVGS